jgi:hypothetical protein
MSKISINLSKISMGNITNKFFMISLGKYIKDMGR